MQRLIVAALITEAIWIASLFLPPWNENIRFFLGLFGVAFLLYGVSWKFLSQRLSQKNSAHFSNMLLFIVASGVLFRLTLLFSSPTLSDDIYRYLWDGRVQLAGINPYLYAPDNPALAFLRDLNFSGINHKSVFTIYPPLAQSAFFLTAWISSTLMAQRLVFVGFDMGLLFLLIFYLRQKNLPPERVFLYAWNPLVLVEFSSSGHLDSMGLFFLMAGLMALDAGKIRRAGLVWGLGFLSKLGSVILLPWIIIKRSARQSLGPFFLTMALGYLAYFLWPLLEVKNSLMSGTVTYARDWTFNAGLYALLSNVTHLPGILLRALLFGGVFLASLFMARRWPKDHALAYTGVIWACLMAVSPVVHPWYAVWLVPFLCFFPLAPGILFTGLVALSYLVLEKYSQTGIWQLPAWVPWVEYGPVLGLLAYSRLRHLRKRNFFQAPKSMPLNPLKAAIIIPALNEAEALPRVMAEIPRESVSRIIVVDNGSTDGTGVVARGLGAYVVREDKQGYGGAVLAGMAHLPPDVNVVVILDGDHSDYPEDLTKLLRPLQNNEADIVIGSRVLGGAPPDSLTPQQRFGNWLSCLMICYFFDHEFTDLGPFRAIRRDVLENLRLKDKTFGWNVEMQIKAIRAGVRIREVPVRYRRRIGVSKISGTVVGTFRAGVKIIWTILKFGLMENPSQPLISNQTQP